MTTASTAGPWAIQTRGLTKHFGAHAAVSAVDLAVPSGAVFGFLGPNGSGKTTTIRMLLGLANASSGEIEVLGRPMPSSLRDVLPRVGALVEGPAFYPFLNGSDNLLRLDSADRSVARSSRHERVARALERVGLTHAAHKKVRAYSLGMKQRLGIANALLAPRQLLVLDEPTNGLDPQGTREVRSLVGSLADEGTTVFVSSHLLSEIDQMCTHAAVMSAGKLVAQGTLDELRGSGTRSLALRTPDVDAAERVLRQLRIEPTPRDASHGEQRGKDKDLVTSVLVDSQIPPEVIVKALVDAEVRIRGFTIESASLEERFVALTGEGFDIAE